MLILRKKKDLRNLDYLLPLQKLWDGLNTLGNNRSDKG